MSIDTSIALNAGFGRQDGFFTRSSSSEHDQQAVSGRGDAQAATDKGQDVSVNEQVLPPGGNAGKGSQLQQAVSDINSYVQNLQRDLQFEVDAELGRTIITVVDSTTKEVIRQLPPEQVLERARRLEKLAGADGLLLEVKI